MYARVCRIAADPEGRGPMATIWLRCSQALLLSNTALAPGPAGAAAPAWRRLRLRVRWPRSSVDA